MSVRFRDYDHFAREVLRTRYGPMTSAAEDIADEMYQQDFTDDFDTLFDDADDEEQE